MKNNLVPTLASVVLFGLAAGMLVQPAKALDTYKFDFGTATPASGYIQVTSANVKTTGVAYGFIGTGMTDTAAATVVTAGTEFAVDVPNEDYTVTVVYGDTVATNAGTTIDYDTGLVVPTDILVTDTLPAVNAAAIAANATRTDTLTGTTIASPSAQAMAVATGRLVISFTGTNIHVSQMTITPRAARTAGATPTLYLLGDSTVTASGGADVNTSSAGVVTSGTEYGWNKNFSTFINTAGLTVSDVAVSGRAMHSFYVEGRINPIFTQIKPGDFVIIEMGNNDSNYSNTNRYCSPAAFKTYVTWCCKAALARGATPIIISVLNDVRDMNESAPALILGNPNYTNAPWTSTSQILHSFAGWAQGARDVAAQLGVPFYDLNQQTYQLFKANGVAWTLANVITVDGVHPNATSTIMTGGGPAYIARMVADGLAHLGLTGLSNNMLANTTVAAPPVVTGITPDTGRSSTDGITNHNTLTFSGTCLSGDTLITMTRADLATDPIVSGISGVIGTAVPSGTTWSFDYTGTTLADGVYTFNATGTHPSGITPMSFPLVVTVDTTAPNAPSIASATSSSGGSPMVISGTAEAGSTVAVSQTGTGAIGTVTTNGSTNWSFTYTNSTSLLPGLYTFTATATDAAGNTGAASAGFATSTTAAPSFVSVTTDTGSSSTDRITNDNTLALNGTADPNSVVTVTRADTGVIGSIAADGSGNWSFDYTGTTLSDGLYTFTATATLNGDTSVPSTPFIVTVDTAAPGAPVITSLATTIPVLFNGTAEAGSTVAVTQAGTGVIGTITADVSGNWSFTYTNSANLAPGTYTFTATATDAAGNLSSASAPSTGNITPLPGAPTIAGVSPDTGISSTDGITNTGAITLNGTAQVASTVTVTQAGAGAIGTITADGSGNWSFTPGSALSSGTYTFTTTATNAGGTGPVSSAFVVTVDTIAPTVISSNRQSPATTNVAPGSNVTYQVVFSEAVSGVTTAAFTLTVSGADTGTIATVTAVSGTTYNVTVNNVQGAFYDTLRLDVNAGVTDPAGNAAGGFTSGQTYTLLIVGNGTWINTASGGLWGGPSNWSGNTIASGTGNTANFSTLDLTADNTVHLDSAQTINRLVFADTATATGANWILDNNGSAANTLTLGGTAPTITVNAMGTGNTTAISAVVAGTAGLAKLGVGTLVLSGANTISGAVTIGNTTSTATAVSGGIIRLDTGASLTASTLTIGPIGTLGGANAGVIVNGGTLLVTGATALDGGAGVIAAVPARNIIEVDSGAATFTGAFATSLETSTLKITGGTVTFSSTLNFFKSASNTTSDPTSHSIDFSGTAGGIIITGGNTTATGAVGLGRNAAGATMIVSGGTTTLNSTLLLANGISTVNKGGGLRVTGGTLTVNDTAAGLVLISKGTSILNNFAVAEFAGGVSTVGRISIAGDTSQTTGIGQVYVDGGTLYIGAGGIATPAGTSAAPGTYLYSVKLGGSGFLPGLTVAGASNVTGVGGTQFTGDGILGAAANWSSAVNMVLGGNTTLQAADAGGTAHHITLSGVLSGAGGLVKTGGGTLTLSGNNTYTGTLVVNAGTLEKSGAGASAIILNNGGAVAPGTNGTVGTLGASSLTWNGGGQALFDLGTSSDQIALTGALTKGNAGTYGFVFTGGTSLANGTTITLATFGSTNFTAQDLSATGGPAGSFAVNAANLQFVVSAIGTIAGTVTDASSVAISGANVSVVVSGTTYSATSGSDGTYAIGSVPAGTGYTVTASATSYLNGTATNIAVTAGGTTSGVNFALNTSLGTITGTVMDNVSAAISGASVSVVVSGTTYSATSGSDGTYAITSVPAGTGYTVTASATGYLNGTATNVAVTAGGTTPGINFALSPAITTGTITGTVTNSASAAISGASVSVVVGGTTYSATSTVNGTYEIDSVPAGTGYTVTASKTGYANGTATGVPVTAGQTTANVNITLTVSFASWAATHFTLAELADPSISGPAADPDHDGIPNLLEYAFNLNPKAADRGGLPVLGTTTVSGSQYLTLSYTQQTPTGDLTYAIQSSPDMAVWSAVTPVPVSAVDNGNGTQTVVVRDPVALDSSTHRFLRVQVSAP